MHRKLITIILFAILGILYIILKRSISPWADAFFKALPSLFLMVMMALSADVTCDKATVVLPLSALFFSILGDTAGEVPFLHGDAAFLYMVAFFALAHVCYMVSFVRYADREKKHPAALLIPAYFVAFWFVLTPGLPEGIVRTSIYAYMAIILMMGMAAAMQRREEAPLFIIGALVFIASDSMLAYNRFVGHIPCRDIMVMGTYYAAQLLLNISLIKDKK